MDEEKKARLAEYAKKKRGVLLRDVPVADLLIGADYAEIELGILNGPPIEGPRVLAYLKYASGSQVAALAGRLWHVVVRIPGNWRVKPRDVIGFDERMLVAVLTRTVTDPKKYYTRVPAELSGP